MVFAGSVLYVGGAPVIHKGRLKVVKTGEYKDINLLKNLLNGKYILDCGHKVTFKHPFANNVVVLNDGKEIKVICTDCYQ